MDRKIVICATDLAVITKHNPYKETDEIILKYWKRYFKDDYLKFIDYVNSKNKILKKEETDMETIKRISKENNVNVNIFKCLKSQDVTELNENKDKIFKKIENKMSESDKALFSKSFNTITNTNFGIKYENKGGKLYEEKTNNKIIKDSTYFKKELFEIPNEFNKTDIWMLGGKIDGILLPENTIIEIKNRVNHLFYKLRNYEKVQCYTYMFLLDSLKTELIEVLKKPNDNSINIIEIPFEEDFWENQIMVKLDEFINDFYDFLENSERKLKLICA